MMQKLIVEITVDEDRMNLKIVPQSSGTSCLAEFMIYSDIVAEVRMLLLAITGEPSCKESMDAAVKIKELMEKAIALRIVDNNDFLMLSGKSPDEEVDQLYSKYEGDNLASVREMLSEKIGSLKHKVTKAEKE